MAKNILESAKDVISESRERPKLPWDLRLIMVIFALNMVLTLIGLILSSRDLVTYDAASIFDWLNLVFEAVAALMIWNRYKYTRAFVLGFTTFNIVAGTLWHVFAGNLDVGLQLASIMPDVIFFLYFAFAPHVREYLVEDIDFSAPPKQEGEFKIERWTWPFVRNLAIYYCVFSFLGHWMEMGFCLAIKAGLVAGEYDPSNTMLWRDWFYPFPIEGMAVVIIGVFLYPLWRWLVSKTNILVGSAISFVVNGLLCGLMEYICGLMWNKNLELWNYSNMPFNFQGQVCLQNVLGFAFASSLIAWFIYPWLERTLAKLPDQAMNIAFAVIMVLFLIPACLYLVDPPIDYRTEIETALAEDDAHPGYLSEAERKEYEENLAYLDYLDKYKAENAERLERERAEAAAASANK